jgi:hypothetical protein
MIIIIHVMKYYNNEYSVLCEELPLDIVSVDDCYLPFENSEIIGHCKQRAMSNAGIVADQIPNYYRGYVGFHDQNLQSWIDGKGIYLSYGSFKDNATDADHIAIGNTIIQVCNRIGLEYSWSGSLSDKINLQCSVSENKVYEGDPYYLNLNGILCDWRSNHIETFSGKILVSQVVIKGRCNKSMSI